MKIAPSASSIARPFGEFFADLGADKLHPAKLHAFGHAAQHLERTRAEFRFVDVLARRESHEHVSRISEVLNHRAVEPGAT